MKVLNITDLNILKIFLNKYYIAHNMEYMFVSPEKDLLKKHILEMNPDVILIQNQYHNMNAYDIVISIRNLTKSPVIVFNINDDSDSHEVIHKTLDSLGSIHILDKKEFFENAMALFNKLDAQKSNDSELFERPKKVILYVDDSPVMHQFIKESVNDRTIEILEAYDGEEALEIYNRMLPNMVITDIEMPKMNGLELCKQIKLNNQGRYIPVIILSSRNKSDDIDNGFNYGADDYLTKPVTSDELNRVISEYFTVLERKKRNKILLVDDSKVSAEIIRHALMKNSLNVIVAHNGQEAFETAMRERPEVIITDIEMPILNGYELAKKVRETTEIKEAFIVMMSARDKKSDIKKGEKLGISRYFTKPFDVEKLVIVVEQLLLEKYNIYKKENEHMLATIRALVTALEARDEYTKGHTVRVSEYSVALAKYIGLSAYTLDELEIAANLHDIGKIGVRDDILLKPGKLSDEEYAKIQEHPIIGAEILKPIKSLENIVPLILFHHERWDGKGYPTKIKGEAIPLGARIIAVADTYDAITSSRPYRKALTNEKACQIIEENLGLQFCPKTGRAFLDMMLKNKNQSQLAGQ